MKLDGDYVTIKEAAIIMGRKGSQISQLCVDGRLEGCIKFANSWMIPRASAAAYVPAPIGRPPKFRRKRGKV